jgi:hypothetical protein
MKMRQAIQTTFIGPTNHKGGRVKAKADAGSITLAWDYSLGVEGNHKAAAKALAVKLGWNYTAWIGGSMFGKGYVFTMIDLGRETEYAFILPGTAMEKAA